MILSLLDRISGCVVSSVALVHGVSDLLLDLVVGSVRFCVFVVVFFFFQAEDGIRDLVRSRGLGDVYKRQVL